MTKLESWTALGRGRNRRYTLGGWVIVPRSGLRRDTKLRWALSRSGEIHAIVRTPEDGAAIVAWHIERGWT